MNQTLITSFVLCCLGMAHGAAAPKVFAPLLQPLIDDHVIAGAVVLVANKDKVLDQEAVGHASVAQQRPMQADSMFWIASMSKSITATAFMMLVDQGTVRIEDPVEKYLPEFKGQMVQEEGKAPRAASHPITIREVLSHTSSLIRADDKRLKRTQSLKADIADAAKYPLLRDPRTKYEYNNTGIDAAGRIIEVVSGMPYVDFVRTRLLEPLGMKDTTYWPTEEQAARLASSVKLIESKSSLEDIDLNKNTPQALMDKLGQGTVHVPQPVLTNFGFGKILEYREHYGEPAGGLFSTAADVGKFCRMLLNGGELDGKRYLTKQAVKEMTSIQTGNIPVTPSEAYGLGWSIKIRNDEGPSVGSFGHRGARKTMMWVDPANELVMVLMVQNWDMPPDGPKRLYSTFMKAAVEKYGKAHP